MGDLGWPEEVSSVATGGFVEAISWTGADVTLVLFAIFPEGKILELEPPRAASEPLRVRTYEMDDYYNTISGRRCVEYDIVFQELPPDIDQVAAGWLDSAKAAGAQLAWLTCEGTFSFVEILTDAVADSVFGVATQQGCWLALEDEYRRGPLWRQALGAISTQLVFD